MKYVKMLGLLAVAAAALMAFVGTASATVTSGGSAYNGTLTATSTDTELHSGFSTVSCNHSEVSGTVTNGGTTSAISTLDFTNCSQTVTVVAKGSLKAEKAGGTLATVSSANAEVTILSHVPFFGTVHCTYRTAAGYTKVGSLTQHTNTMHIESAAIPVVGITSDGLCGSTAEWTGTYTITTPGAITVD